MAAARAGAFVSLIYLGTLARRAAWRTFAKGHQLFKLFAARAADVLQQWHKIPPETRSVAETRFYDQGAALQPKRGFTTRTRFATGA